MESQKLILPKVMQIDKYCVQFSFSAGGQGQVYLCSSENELYAVKIPLRSKNYCSDRFLKQSIFIQNLSHPNIIKLIEFKKDAEITCENKTKIHCPITVLQFAQEGDLFDYSMKRSYSQTVCRTIFGQIIDAMTYLHYEKKVMHLDLKMENILVTKDFDLKLTDFGHAKAYQEIQNLLHPFGYGTAWWVPPQYDDFQQFSGEKVDVFNCGLILCKLLTSTVPIRKTPFVRKDELYGLLKKSKYESFWHYFKKRMPSIQISTDAQRLILCMIEPDPKKRLTFKQVTQNEWFTKTKPASHEVVVGQFMKQKHIFLIDPHMKQMRQKLEQIKRFFEKVNECDKFVISEPSSNRGSGVQSICEYFKQIKTQTNFFSGIPQKNKYGVTFCSYKPQFIIVYLKKELQAHFQNKYVMIDNSFGIYKPLQYRLQLKGDSEGVLKIKSVYQCPSTSIDIQIGQNQLQASEGCQNGKQYKTDKDSSHLDGKEVNSLDEKQEQFDEIKVQVYGQIIQNNSKYGVDWDLEINRQDYWSKQTILQLKRVLRLLGQKLEENTKL